MTPVTASWAAAGIILGLLHALALWRSARAPRRNGRLALVRFLATGAMLVGAALLGELLPAALGWGCAFPLSVTGLVLWGRP